MKICRMAALCAMLMALLLALSLESIAWPMVSVSIELPSIAVKRYFTCSVNSIIMVPFLFVQTSRFLLRISEVVKT